jgi:hypothetical protein
MRLYKKYFTTTFCYRCVECTLCPLPLPLGHFQTSKFKWHKAIPPDSDGPSLALAPLALCPGYLVVVERCLSRYRNSGVVYKMMQIDRGGPCLALFLPGGRVTSRFR